jgi:hypothetical protein
MNALTNRLGRFLFPRLQPWQQKRDARLFLAATGTALVFAVVVGLVIFWQNYSGKF